MNKVDQLVDTSCAGNANDGDGDGEGVMVELVRRVGDMEVTEGDDAWFEVEVSGSSACELSIGWYKDDDLIPADDDDFRQTFDGHVARLYITGTYLDDAGLYTCIASSSDGRRLATVAATLCVNGLLARFSTSL